MFGRLLSVGVLILLILTSGCVGQNTGIPTASPGGTAPETASQTSSEVSQSENPTSQSVTQTETSRPTGVQTYRLLNRTVAINATVVPDATWKCSNKAPAVIKGYYNAVKNEENVSGFFDLSVVDGDSLTELHQALYEVVDFKDLKVEDIECFPASTQLVACKYHYSAVIVKDDQQMSIERDYVTFLSGRECGIIWTEVGG